MNIKEVQIGYQVWIVENLNVSHFQNGDPIPEAKTDEEWRKYGENQNRPGVIMIMILLMEKHTETYSKLYNWYAVIDSRGLAPEG